MRGILLKTGIVNLFSFLVIYVYYFVFTFHKESFTGGYLLYISLLGIGYSIYKFFYVQFSEESYKFNPLVILSLFVGHLFIFCLVFFNLNNLPLGYGLILLFKILFFSFLPLILFFISHSFGELLLGFIPGFQGENKIVKVALSLGVGFSLYVTGLTILAFIGEFTAIPFFIYTFGIIAISYKNIIKNTKDLFGLSWELPLHDFTSGSFFKGLQPYTLTTEFLFIVITALISTNLINIVRPFPIGWDDLGVYMNYANLIGNLGHMPLFGQMVSWQVFTATGFVLGSTTQAFFLNSFSGIISLLAIIFGIKFVSESGQNSEKHGILSVLHLDKNLKSFISIPLLAGAIYLSLPMVIFHLAKDMKLDQGLLFISITSVLGVFYILTSKEERASKINFIYLFIIGIIVGFAFSIKLTTLLLISGIIGTLIFSEMGILGFTGYAFLFFGIFTKFHLWDFLNVVYPKENLQEIDFISYSFFIIGIISLTLSILKVGNTKLKQGILDTCVFLLGVLIALIPWFTWNIHSLEGKLSLVEIIGGKNESYIPNLEGIRGKEYVDKKILETSNMTNSGKTLNEDFGRYFGYEDGINNYLKIFWNISMQVNQRGEFTEISYLFFALIPGILLFLPIRKRVYEYTLYGVIAISIGAFMIIPISNPITNLFATINLPLGYIFVIIPFIFYLLFSIYAIEKEDFRTTIFKLNAVLMTFYTFLWAISAFGIVWYGITMYFLFLTTIGICLAYINFYQGKENSQENVSKAIATYTIFIIISIYFVFSSFPHLFNNIQTAGYQEYKIGSVGEKEAIFQAHSEYLDFLYALNISPLKQKDFLDNYKSNFIKLLGNSSQEQQLKTYIQSISSIDLFVTVLKNIESSNQISDIQIKSSAKNVHSELYSNLIYPSSTYRSSAIIYRVGTFMRYFISENQKRIFEDSLLGNFQDYIYDKDSTVITKRFKKLGVSQILLDLNAATIDNDPRKDLTRRFENILSYLASDDVEYVSGDSLCFSIALGNYKNSKKTKSDLENFILTAGVNYDSSLPNGETISKNKKITNCFYTIKSMVENNQVTDSSPEMLKNINTYTKQNGITTTEDWVNKIGPIMSPGYKVLFRIK